MKNAMKKECKNTVKAISEKIGDLARDVNRVLEMGGAIDETYRLVSKVD